MPPQRDSLRTLIEQFIRSAENPVLLEAGEEEIPLTEGSWSVDAFGRNIRIHAWTDDRSYSRTITRLKKNTPGRLEFSVSRLGKPEGTLALLDLLHGRNQPIRQRNLREFQKEQFRRMLTRQFPEWTISHLSTAPDLEHSLSPSYPRATLQRKKEVMAVIFSPEEAMEPEAALTFGLIWLEHVHKQEQRRVVSTLIIFLPESKAQRTALRMKYLNASAGLFRLFVYTDVGEYPADIQDYGNLDTTLRPAQALPLRTRETPEFMLETLLQKSIRIVDAALDPEPVYRQALSITALDRGVMDLLAVDFEGRLAIIELKTGQDIHLPLQALDYWISIQWHLKQGSFPQQGYFPHRQLAQKPPLLYLVAPSLEFHPTTALILRYLAHEVPVICLGLGANWRCELKVVSRQENNEYSWSVKRRSREIEP